MPGADAGRADEDRDGGALSERLLQRLLPRLAGDEVPFVEEGVQAGFFAQTARQDLDRRFVGAVVGEEDMVVSHHFTPHFVSRGNLISKVVRRPISSRTTRSLSTLHLGASSVHGKQTAQAPCPWALCSRPKRYDIQLQRRSQSRVGGLESPSWLPELWLQISLRDHQPLCLCLASIFGRIDQQIDEHMLSQSDLVLTISFKPANEASSTLI